MSHEAGVTGVNTRGHMDKGSLVGLYASANAFLEPAGLDVNHIVTTFLNP